MKIGKEEVVQANALFGGKLIQSSSLDFALQMQGNPRIGEFRKLAYLWRAILVDHPFTDGNKRTAVALAAGFARDYGLQGDKDALMNQAVEIAAHNLTDLRCIERRLRNAIK